MANSTNSISPTKWLCKYPLGVAKAAKTLRLEPRECPRLVTRVGNMCL